MKWKDIGVRAAKTFVQAFMGAISIDVLFASSDRSVWRSVLLGGIAAGFSAVWNFALHELKGENENV
jgi:hypothetical protein